MLMGRQLASPDSNICSQGVIHMITKLQTKGIATNQRGNVTSESRHYKEDLRTGVDQ